MESTLTAEQVAARLGVKLATVYAYVSRGALQRSVAEDGRTSRFDPAEVERLARRGRPRRGQARVGTVDVSLATSITGILGNRLVYRGHDVSELAATSTFEAVAELLWTGELPRHASWPAPPPPCAAVVSRVRALLPASSPATERFAATAAAVACTQPLRVDLREEAVWHSARTLITSFVEALPVLARASASARPARPAARARAATSDGRAPSVAAQLWPRLAPAATTPARVALLDRALILLADHELATSTLAARVAASTRADPYAVVLAGLGAVSGPLHGRAAQSVHRLLLDARSAPEPAHAVANVLAASAMVPGFGHPLYQGVDPRAVCLLEAIDRVARSADRRVIEAVIAASASNDVTSPNADFALGALAFVAGMPVGATEAIFSLARTAGWIAHALEEYGEVPLRFRARAIYVGDDSRKRGATRSMS
jgi:citrate synthase